MNVKWYESWIIRAGLLAIVVLTVGFATSMFVTVEAINSFSSFVHDDDTESSLAAHLEKIKDVQELRQQLLAEKLTAALHAQHSKGAALTEAEIRGVLAAAQLPAWAHAESVAIQRQEDGVRDEGKTAVEWLDHQHMRLGSFVLAWKNAGLLQDYRAAESVRQRYQLLGVNLRDNIRPTLIRANAIIFLGIFCLLGILLSIIVKRFHSAVEEIIRGFSLWSAEDGQFRFVGHETGELGILRRQFNLMADDVARNREKFLYLEKLASWQIIARKLAHEIKNPLTPIQMMVSQIRRRYSGTDENFQHFLEETDNIVTQEIKALRNLVDHFSHFAKLPSPELREVDLVPLARQTVELMAPAFPTCEMTLRTQLQALKADVDPELLRQALINLIKNAAEANTAPGGKITLHLDDEGGHVLLIIEDNGPGIPAELRERIFEAYFSTKNTGPSPGMGLGLAICQKIILDHGGQIVVKSAPGKTTFSVRLPKHKTADTQ